VFAGFWFLHALKNNGSFMSIMILHCIGNTDVSNLPSNRTIAENYSCNLCNTSYIHAELHQPFVSLFFVSF
jgi:hypothetical protein